MGQHKYNPNCQLAREGKLPPKPKKMGKTKVLEVCMEDRPAEQMTIVGVLNA